MTHIPSSVDEGNGFGKAAASHFENEQPQALPDFFWSHVEKGFL